jgi:membrane protein implicated in regulation of membrane protease activity
MLRDSEGKDGPNWWMIAAFVVGGTGMLALAYYMSSYWQGVLVNSGTALFLTALFVFFEPRLVHHLRQPQTLNEALTRFNPLVAPLAHGPINSSAQIKDGVLRAVGKTGLHQEPPESSAAHFTNLGGTLKVEWCVEWGEKGLRHSVTAEGKKLPRSMSRHIGWDKSLVKHEKRIYKILCYLLEKAEPRT